MTDKYLTIDLKMLIVHIQVHLKKIEYGEKVNFFL